MASEASIVEAATYPRGFSRDSDWKWPMVPARNLVTLNYERALKADTRSPGKVPVYGTSGQCGLHNKSLAKAPGLILGRKGQGPRGVEWCDKDFWVIDTAYYAGTLTPDVDLKYLYHLVKYVGLNHFNDGTSNPTLSRDTFGAQMFPLPRLSEQKQIAQILGTLDDKIELNRRMNATLEAMARVLFQSWFVDFDPTRRNSDGQNPSPEDSLFSDSFEDSAIEEIPAGWDVMSLYDTATYRNGAPFKPGDFCPNGDGFSVVKIAELKSGLAEQTKWSNKQLGSDQMIGTGDLLYSWSGSPDTSLDAFLWSNGPGLVNQHIFKVITSMDAEKRFVYYLLKHLRPILVETARDKQTTGLGHVTVADMKRLQVCRPPRDVLAAFDKLIAPIFDKAFSNTLESQTLATLRDTLLPKLLSGEPTFRNNYP